MKTKLSVIQKVTTDGLYCGESKQELCPKYVPGGMCGQFDFIDLRSDEDGWLRADACIKAEERAQREEGS